MELDQELLEAEQSSGEESDHSSQLGLGSAGPKSDNNDATGHWLVRSYARFLARFPYIIPLLVLAFAGTCGYLSFKFHPLPDYGKKPHKGMETRGTSIAKATATGVALVYHLKKADTLFLVPNITRLLNERHIDPASLGLSLGTENRSAISKSVFVRSRKDRQSMDKDSREELILEPNQTCSQRTIEKFKMNMFAYESTTGDLFTVQSMQQICLLEATHFLPLLNTTCPLISLPFYISLLAGKDNCDELTEDDFLAAKTTLKQCAPYYREETIIARTKERSNDSWPVPEACLRGGYIDTIFTFLTDDHFMKAGSNRLTHAVTYWKKSTTNLDFLKFYKRHIEGRNIQSRHVKLVAVSFPTKHAAHSVKIQLFADYVLKDLQYFGLAVIIVLTLMLLYIQSLFIVVATVFNIAFSFIISYFIYFFVFGLQFYPFFNLLAGLILIAVGADDVFVFHECWEKYKKRQDQGQMSITIAQSFRHATLSIFVTSLTTASAFFSNMVSAITCIQCFGIFAGLSILVNFLLMVTWTPSIFVLSELTYQKLARFVVWELKLFRNLKEKLQTASLFVTGKVFPTVVGKLWFLWISLFLALGIGSIIVVFVTPRFKLPDTPDLQLFPASNTLEYWNLAVEGQIVGLQETSSTDEVEINFIWGLTATDPGNSLNPDDRPKTIIYDNKFDFYSAESQTFLNNFCHSFMNASFVDKDFTRDRVCFLDAYAIMMKRYCTLMTLTHSHSQVQEQCCQSFEVPYNSTHLKLCFPLVVVYYATHINDTSLLGGRSVLGEPLFDPDNSVVAILFRLRANYIMSYDYVLTKDRYHRIQSYLQDELQIAPDGLKSGFFHAWTKFVVYDMQSAIAKGTYYSVAVSLGAAFTLMIITSRNLLVAIYAIISIALAIASTMASMVLLGWNLNIVESFTVSLAVGLSIDFTIHYGVAYRLSSEYEARSRVTETFERVGGAVGMAGLTTFIAGAAVMPSHLLPYIKLGTFLMLCMAFSWTYATFFFQSVCWIAGPRGDCCQIRLKCPRLEKKDRSVVTNGDEALLSPLEPAYPDAATFRFY